MTTVERQRRHRERAKKAVKVHMERIGSATLYLSNCREVLPTLGTVDTIITDPPYNFQSLDCYSILAVWAARLLKPGGFCFAYAGGQFLPETIAAMHLYLDWFWLMHIKHRNGYPSIWNKRLRVVSKYVLVWTKGQARNRQDWIFTDYFELEHRQKSSGHPWEQDTGFPQAAIEMSTAADEVVLDPFMGSGTVGVACANLGRKFIGIEIKREYFEIACERIRLAYAQPRLPFEETKSKAIALELELSG